MLYQHVSPPFGMIVFLFPSNLNKQADPQVSLSHVALPKTACRLRGDDLLIAGSFQWRIGRLTFGAGPNGSAPLDSNVPTVDSRLVGYTP